MIHIGTILRHYKRRDVQDVIVNHGKNLEVAARFGDKFGKRPDVLQYPTDVLELAKQGVTSFHCSEERWKNPLQLSPTMKQRELDSLRIGWDLILDVDCKNWEYSKLITHLLVELVRGFGIRSVYVKFSGNKGFHIGVPFEAFPKMIHGKDVSLSFPDGPRRIATYLVNLLGRRFLEMVPEKDERSIAKAFGISIEELIVRICSDCGTQQKGMESYEFICPGCDRRVVMGEKVNFINCEKCSRLMVRHDFGVGCCVSCGKRDFVRQIDIERLMDVDTLLISSRHLYRAPYSLHEKSGLVSIPVDIDDVLNFEKEMAKPENLKKVINFLPRKGKSDEARQLFIQAFDFTIPKQEMNIGKEIEVPATAIGAEHFPNCVKKLISLEDGRKRALFIIINFLRSVGWSAEQVEEYVREWNEKNVQPLRENYLIGQLRYAKRKKPILPPNCDNTAYYQSMGVKCHDGICMKVKNPVNYAKRVVRMNENSTGIKKVRKAEVSED
jgi:hypothetical protein